MADISTITITNGTKYNIKDAFARNELEELKREVDVATSGYSYKGSAANADSLPSSGNTIGDLYTVGSEQYVWDGSTWVRLDLGLAITSAQIDALF